MQEVLTAGNNQALNTFLVIVIMLSCILICLTVHEFGHFAFAKLFKVNVKEFSIGFGPAIFKTYTKKNYMQITIRLLPIGAYVLLDSAAVRRIYLEEPNSSKYNFYLRPKPYGTLLLEQAKYWQQMIIMFGGILFNIITFSLVLGLWSALNPQAVLNFGAFLKNLFITIGQAFVLYGLWPGQGGGGSGVPPITQQMPDFDFFLRYLISLNLATAILNFLVVPPLDGWKIMLFSYEKITKKKLPENVLTIVSIIGSVLLLWITIGSIINSIAIKS